MSTLIEIGARLRARTEELKGMFDAHVAKGADGNPVKGDKGEALYDFTPDELVEVNKRNDELSELGKHYDALRIAQEVAPAVDARLRQLGEPALSLRDVMPATKARKPLGELVTESAEYKTLLPLFRGGSGVKFAVHFPEFDVKTLMERSAGFDPETIRQDRIVLYGTRPVRVPDLIPSVTTTLDTIRYMEETTFTNNADATAEGGTLGEAALAYTERSTPIEKIGQWLPVTDEQLADVPQLQQLIENRLTTMLMLEEESEIISGSGTTPHLVGLLNKSGIQTQAKGADPAPDAIYKAFTKIRWTGYAEPSAVILHPNDWQDIRLLRDVNGNYIWGSPAEAAPERIWGKPVVVTNGITENTGLVADFQMYVQIYRRQGVVVEASNSHSDFFINCKQAIRIVERACLVIYRAGAICTCTSL